jgi:hypothetical protein
MHLTHFTARKTKEKMVGDRNRPEKPNTGMKDDSDHD